MRIEYDGITRVLYKEFLFTLLEKEGIGGVQDIFTSMDTNIIQKMIPF